MIPIKKTLTQSQLITLIFKLADLPKTEGDITFPNGKINKKRPDMRKYFPVREDDLCCILALI